MYTFGYILFISNFWSAIIIYDKRLIVFSNPPLEYTFDLENVIQHMKIYNRYAQVHRVKPSNKVSSQCQWSVSMFVRTPMAICLSVRYRMAQKLWIRFRFTQLCYRLTRQCQTIIQAKTREPCPYIFCNVLYTQAQSSIFDKKRHRHLARQCRRIGLI